MSSDHYKRLRASGLSHEQAERLVADRQEFREPNPDPWIRASEAEEELAVMTIQRDLWMERCRRLCDPDHPDWKGGWPEALTEARRALRKAE